MREPGGKTVVVLQPMLFPWIGHLEQVRLAHVFVHYDDVQYSPGSLVNRVRVKTAAGSDWLTVPLERHGLQRIADVRLHERADWRGKHLRTLAQSLARAPHRDAALALVERVYAARHASLAELSIASVEALAAYFDLDTTFVRSSRLPVGGHATQRVLDLVRHLGGERYVTGHGARHYLQHEQLEQAGIEVRYMDYARMPYPQLHGPFDPHVSALDLVANCGRAGRELIASGTLPWRTFVARCTPAGAARAGAQA